MPRAPEDNDRAEARRTSRWRELAHFGQVTQDPVEHWKESALARVLDTSGLPLWPRIELDVNAGFAVTGVLAGLPFGAAGPLLVTVALTTLVLVPELVRAVLLRRWGRSSFVFVGPGGAGLETVGPKLTGARRVLLAVVGPLANLGLALFLGSVALHLGRLGPAIHTLALWHAGWGLAQALPLAPFVAGAAIQSRLRGVHAVVHQGFSTKLVLLGGLVVAKLVPIAFPLVLLAMSGAVRGFVRCYQAATDEKNGVLDGAERAERLVAMGETTEALRLLRQLLARVREPELRLRLWKCLAWAAIGNGDGFVAHSALGILPARFLDVHLVAAYLAVCGRVDEAIVLLERARVAGQRSRETTKLLLDLLLRRREVVRARRVAREDLALLAGEEVELVERRIFGPADGPSAAAG
jgi:hypothetical protein